MINEWRFWKNVQPEPNSGCLLWLAGLNSSGYPRITHKVNGRSFTVLICRWAYEKFVGPIPDGHQIRHKCRNACCVNHEHMTTGTMLDNIMDIPAEVRLEKSRKANAARVAA